MKGDVFDLFYEGPVLLSKEVLGIPGIMHVIIWHTWTRLCSYKNKKQYPPEVCTATPGIWRLHGGD